MTVGDTEPEDGYDASDPIPVRLRIIALILLAAAADDDVRMMRRARLAARLLRDLAGDDG